MRARRNIIIPTEFGMMMVNRFDYNEKGNFPGVGYHLLNHGNDNMESVFMFAHYLGHCRAPVVIDVGANIGAFTVQIASGIHKTGTVYAFEPQRQIYQMLNGNVAMNSLDNVYALQLAVGNKSGTAIIPKLNYYAPGSFGSVGLTGEYDDVGQDLDFGNGEKVTQITLDDYFAEAEQIDAIKIDVEGMEYAVIEGAKEVIKKHRPLLYVEFLKQPNNGNDLAQFITSMGYHIMVSHINFLCVPEEKINDPAYGFIKEMKNDRL